MSEPPPTPTLWWRFLLFIVERRYGKVLSGPEARWSRILYGNQGFLPNGSSSQERAASPHPLFLSKSLGCLGEMASPFTRFIQWWKRRGLESEYDISRPLQSSWTRAGRGTNSTFSPFTRVLSDFHRV